MSLLSVTFNTAPSTTLPFSASTFKNGTWTDVSNVKLPSALAVFVSLNVAATGWYIESVENHDIDVKPYVICI